MAASKWSALSRDLFVLERPDEAAPPGAKVPHPLAEWKRGPILPCGAFAESGGVLERSPGPWDQASGLPCQRTWRSWKGRRKMMMVHTWWCPW